MNADQAITAHRQWKARLLMALGKQEQLNVADISSDHCCQFGKWLYSVEKARIGELESYRHCVDVHAAFHLEAGKVAQLVNTGEVRVATEMLAFDAPFAKASETLVMAVIAMFKEADNG